MKREIGRKLQKHNRASVLKSAFDDLKEGQSSVENSPDCEIESIDEPDELDSKVSELIGQVLDDVIKDIELEEAAADKLDEIK